MDATPVVIDKHDALQHFAIAQIIGRLKIETGTGLKFKQSTLKIVQQVYGIKARTKQEALDGMLELYRTTYGRNYGSSEPFRK